MPAGDRYDVKTTCSLQLQRNGSSWKLATMTFTTASSSPARQTSLQLQVLMFIQYCPGMLACANSRLLKKVRPRQLCSFMLLLVGQKHHGNSIIYNCHLQPECIYTSCASLQAHQRMLRNNSRKNVMENVRLLTRCQANASCQGSLT